MSVKPENIKLLREKTGAGMMDCKSALNETNGDLERDEEWLRKKGINTAQKKISTRSLRRSDNSFDKRFKWCNY